MATGVVGRDIELAAIGKTLDAARCGLSVLVLEGHAGIGKTTVWCDAINRAEAAGFRVLVCRAAAAEARISYAALGDLLSSIEPPLIDALPVPQRRAINVALLRADAEGVAAGQRAVATALASLVARLTDTGPVALAIDDVQWLDQPTGRALRFALRRLEAHAVAVLVTHRSGAVEALTPLADMPGERIRRQRLGPLSVAALHAVLTRDLGRPIPRPLLLRICEVSRGNPFYALELLRAVDTNGGLAAGQRLSVPEDLRTLLARRLRCLSGSTRRALLAVSAMTSPTTAVVSEADLAPAEEAGIVRIDDGRVTFNHPLFASAVYQSVSTSRRRQLHGWLAGELTDIEERARHLALSRKRPDEQVAGVLEAGASRARERGAPDAAGELQELAANFTPPEDVLGCCRRATVAAGYFFHAGDRHRARWLLETALADVPRGRERGEVLRLLSDIRYHENSYRDARLLLHEALGEDDQPEFEVPVRVALAEASFNAGDLPATLAHARRALDLAEHLGNHALLAEAMAQVGAAQVHTGDRAGWEKLDRAVTLEDRNRAGPIQLRPSVLVAELTAYEGRLRDAAKRMYELRAWFAERGEESDLPHLLFYIAWLEWYRGDYLAARDAMEEAVTLAEQADSDTMLGFALTSRAHAYVGSGQIAAARADLDRARVLLEPTGWPLGRWMFTWTTGFLELSVGNLGAARSALAPAVEVLELNHPIWVAAGMVVFDAVEVLVGRGELARAEALLDPYEAWFDELGVAWLIVAAARCRALLLAARGDLDGALAATEVALSLEDQLEMPLELARTLLVTGQVQRRARRRGAARVSLVRALEICEQIGAPLWAGKARAELDRLGARTEAGDLTTTEARVAAQAAIGHTNRQIAAQLFLSRRTVEANLARAYQKLSIHSRAQLSAALAARPDA